MKYEIKDIKSMVVDDSSLYCLEGKWMDKTGKNARSLWSTRFPGLAGVLVLLNSDNTTLVGPESSLLRLKADLEGLAMEREAEK